MNIKNITIALGLLLAAACGKVEVDTEWKPQPMPEPPCHSFGIDIDFTGDTAFFVRAATLYFITQQGADSVALVEGGDTTALDNGRLYLENAPGLHLRTTRSAALFEGWVTMVMRDLPDPPAEMAVEVALSRDDTLYFSQRYTVATSEISRTLRLSSDAEAIRFE